MLVAIRCRTTSLIVGGSNDFDAPLQKRPLQGHFLWRARKDWRSALRAYCAHLRAAQVSNRIIYGRRFESFPSAIKKGPCRAIFYGAPGRIRTSDPLVRSQVLYPAELRAREGRDYQWRPIPCQIKPQWLSRISEPSEQGQINRSHGRSSTAVSRGSVCGRYTCRH